MSNTDDKKDLQSFVCPGCKKRFDYQICSNVFTGRIPLILLCGHTICEECVKLNLQRREVSCCECNKKSSIGEGEKKTLQECFMVNFYILGKIMYLNPKSNSMPGLQNKFLRQRKHVTSASSSDTNSLTVTTIVNKLSACSQEKCTNIAKLYCQNCEEKYCENCSITIHKMARAFRTHKILPISNPTDDPDLEIHSQCPLHVAGIIDFHCSTCDTDVCCYCILQSHVSHQYQQLTDLNQSDMSDFENLISTAEQKLKTFKVSLKKIENELKTKSYGKHLRTDFLLSKYFTNLHGRIQCLEKKLKEDIVDEIKNQEATLSVLYSEVDSKVNSLSKLITIARGIQDSKNVGKINVKNIRNKIEELVTTPSHLYCDRSCKDPDEILDYDIIQQIENIAKNLCTSNVIEYKMLNSDELPHDYVEEVLDSELYEDEFSCDVSSANSVVETDDPLYPYKKHSSKSSTENIAIDVGLKINDYENVTITHINSPESFYINVLRYKMYMHKLNEQIKNYVKTAPKVRNAELQKMYLVRYDYDATANNHKWYRAELINIKADHFDFFFTVYFIDYGNTKKVKLSYLREISFELMQMPPLGFHCKLYGLQYHYEKLTEETQKFMAQMIKNNDTAIKVVDIQKGICEVHLFVFDSYGDCVSVASALEFIGHAYADKEINDVKIPKVTHANSITLYEKVDNYQANQTVFVQLSHVNEESIYIRDYDKMQAMENLQTAMKNCYKFKNKLRIFCVKVGMEIAAEIDENWYRCLVLKVHLGTGMADVKLVDTGKQCKISHTQMRKLTAEFTKMECQAIRVELVDVVPIYEKPTWNKETVELLSQYVENSQKLRMVITDTSKPPKVILFEMHDTYDISINSLLVDKKLADSTGELSSTTKWPRNNIDGACIKEDKKDDSFTLKLMKTIQSNITTANDIDNTDTASKSSIKSAATNAVSKMDKSKLIPVSILKVENPDEIYVSVIAESLHLEYDDLRRNLVAHYAEMSPSKDHEWSSNDICVMIYKPRNEYYRVKILEKCPNGYYKVKLVDFANEVEVSKEQLYLLDKKFKEYPFYAVRCHLDGIQPSGDKKKWSLMACDFVRETLETQMEVFMKKPPTYDKSKKSIPVTIYYKEVISGGALSPDEIVMHSLNDLLVNNGLAFKKKDDWSELIEDEKSNNSTDNLSKIDEVNNCIASSDDKCDLHIDNELVAENSVESDDNEITSYKPAPPLGKNYKFTGIVTYVDDSGLLYIQNSDVKVIYDELERKMKEFFDTVPFDKNIVYSPGDLCTVRYENGNWYRGQIVKNLNPNTYLVHMTDFGNEEEVKCEDLRHVIMHADIPVLVQRVKLIKVFPNTKSWNTSDTILLQEKVDGVPLSVKVIFEEVGNRPALAEVCILQTKENVNEYMVKYSKNLSNFNPKSQVINKDEDEDVIIMSEDE